MQSNQRWRFGPFEADAAEHRLSRDGVVVPLTRKSFALLATLLGRPGRLFTKAELFATVWAGTVVTDAAMSRVIREIRVALGDDAAAPRYIATAHGLGFRFVALVSLDERPGAPAGEATNRLVGREPELARLDRALADARAGRRHVAFVTGEAGIGKTALVDAFVERHIGAGDVWCARGRCVDQYGSGEPYLPILEALESLAQQVGTAAFRDVLARYAPAWLAQLSWLVHEADTAALPRPAADATAQRLLREIAQALEVLAAEKPIVLWLEDLHWSDPSSLALVSFLAGRPGPARLLLVASFRPADARAADSALPALSLQLQQRGQASEHALGLLDETAVASYLRIRFGAVAALPFAELAAFVRRRTEGNALFMVGVVDDLVRRRALTQEGSVWSLSGRIDAIGDDLPDNLLHLVDEQFERLSESDRRLVEAAAVAGTDFSAAAVAAALQADIETTEDRCARLAQQGRFLRAAAPVAWPDGTVASGFCFLHALYWRGTDRRVPEHRRADWQRRIGLAQEAAYGPLCGQVAAELAMRFEAARDSARSLRYLELAAAAALARCAYGEGIELLRRALAFVPQLPAGQQPRREIDLLFPLGAALMAAQGYASDEVKATYERAVVICRSGMPPADLVRAYRGIWNVVFLRADLDQADAVAAELLRHAQACDNPGMVFDAHAKLGETCLHRGDFAGAGNHLRHALSLPISADDPTRSREAPRVVAYLSWVLWHTGVPTQALARGDEALNLAARTASAHTRAFVLGFVSWLHAFCGDNEAALDLARRQHVLCVEHGLVYWRAWSEFTQGLVKSRQGDARAGADAMAAALAAMRDTRADVGITHFQCLLAEAELEAGRPERALAALEAAAELEARTGTAYAAAETARLFGEVARAETGDAIATGRHAQERFASALDIARRQRSRAYELRAAVSLARLWAASGQPVRAAELLEPVYAGFDEGHGTADLVNARALLDRLASLCSERSRTSRSPVQ